MQKEELGLILQRLKALGLTNATCLKVERYFSDDVTVKERREIDLLVEFVEKVLDKDFFSDRLQH